MGYSDILSINWNDGDLLLKNNSYGKSRKLEDSGQIWELSIKDVGFHNETLGSSDLNFIFLCNAPSKMLDLAIKHSGMANV